MHFAIVSYTFPPSKEIGGRRWAKFSRYLAQKGHAVTVICADNSIEQDWYKKEFSGIKVCELPKSYPTWLGGFTKSLFEKVLYAFYTRILNPLTKQNLYDRAYAWKGQMLNALEKIHALSPIDVLVVTGAPYSLLYYGSIFKSRHKEIVYVADLRDPWTWGSYYGMLTMTAVKKKFQEYSERRSIENADLFCYPTQHMGNVLKEKYPSFESKLYLLAHAYEPDKFQSTAETKPREGFIYGGTLYDGIEDYIKRLMDIVKAHPDSGFKWEIYSGTKYPLLDSDFTNTGIQKHPLIPEETLFTKIRKASAYLAIFPRADKDLVSTKFFEIIYTQTPILYIGEEGDVGRFIRENRLGVHILPENLEKDLPKYLNGNVPFEAGYFDVSQYTFETVTQKFLETLSERKNKSE